MSRFCRILAISYNGSIFQVMMIYWFTLVFVMFTSSDFFFLSGTNWRMEVSTKNKHLDFFLIN